MASQALLLSDVLFLEPSVLGTLGDMRVADGITSPETTHFTGTPAQLTVDLV